MGVWHGPEGSRNTTGQKRGITDKEKLFAEAYMKSLNATKALIEAGYSENYANRQASAVLAKKYVQEYIKQMMKERKKRLQIDADWVLQRFIDISDRCSQAVPVMKFNPISKSMEQETVVNDEGEKVGVYTFDSSGANKATEMIGKHIGFFQKDNEQLQPQVNVGDTQYKIEKRKKPVK